VQLPDGWHELPFDTTSGDAHSVGVQMSNVALPAPTVRPGYPIQVNGKDLPDEAIGLIIATDENSSIERADSTLPEPPLDMDMFSFGSAPAGEPTLTTLWFSGKGEPYLATIKTGPNVGHSDEAALEEIVASLRFDRSTTST
jgi:hypothetical protein